ALDREPHFVACREFVVLACRGRVLAAHLIVGGRACAAGEHACSQQKSDQSQHFAMPRAACARIDSHASSTVESPLTCDQAALPPLGRFQLADRNLWLVPSSTTAVSTPVM